MTDIVVKLFVFGRSLIIGVVLMVRMVVSIFLTSKQIHYISQQCVDVPVPYVNHL